MAEAPQLQVRIRADAEQAVKAIRDVTKAIDDLAAAWRRFRSIYEGAPIELKAAIDELLPLEREEMRGA